MGKDGHAAEHTSLPHHHHHHHTHTRTHTHTPAQAAVLFLEQMLSVAPHRELGVTPKAGGVHTSMQTGTQPTLGKRGMGGGEPGSPGGRESGR